MSLIELTQGKYAEVDAEDKPRLLQSRWQAACSESTGKYYAVGSEWCESARRYRRVPMTHAIVGKPPARMVVDHIDGNTLNNCRANLRFATYSQNITNAKLRRDNSSGHRGVRRVKSNGRWQAQIQHAGWTLSLGCFPTFEQAVAMYRDAAIKLRGDYLRADSLSIP